MFILRKTKQVEAAHKLPHHDGKCKGLHGHTWTITVEVQGTKLHDTGPKRGMLFDYYDLGVIMKEHVESLDHRFLNDIYDNPTSEVIARDLYGKMWGLIDKASHGRALLSRVIVSETANSACEYTEAA